MKSQSEAIETLLEQVSATDIAVLPSLAIEPFTLPSAGVDVMRVQLEETYDIDGSAATRFR